MSDAGDRLSERLDSIIQEGAVRAVILHNSDMISDAFRLKVLRREIRQIEERMATEGPGVDKAVRRQLRWSEELRKKAREAESPGTVDGEDAS